MTVLVMVMSVCGAMLLTSERAIGQDNAKGGNRSAPRLEVGVHFSPGTSDSGDGDLEAIARETEDSLAGKIEQPIMTPTRSSFLAKWQRVKGAQGYRLDVSTTSSFDSYVNGYRDLDIGKTTSHIVSGLSRGTKYYYRVRPYSSAGIGSNSKAKTETTADTGAGLVINPTFDDTIINDPRSDAIQAMIFDAIDVTQALFSDPITVSIRFRYSGFHLDGTPLDYLIGASNSGIYQLDWGPFIAALKTDGTTVNDLNANATLPTTVLSPIILCRSANGRAVGLDTPSVMFADGSLGDGGPYDGIITINSLKPVQFIRPVADGNFDAQMFTEHEIDEVLGLGSHLGGPAPQYLAPQDLFSWSSLNVRNTTSSGLRFFSIDRGLNDIVIFNQDPAGDFGDWDSDTFCPADRLYVQNAFNCPGPGTDIAATSPEGINLDVIGYDLVPDNSVLGNISTRLPVYTGDNVLIVGFVITGPSAKQIVVRGIGPTLGQFGIANPMQDPTLELHDATGAILTSNDDWQDADNSQSIPTGLQPLDELESAILTTLDPGAYTAILRGYQDSTGIALVEVYDTAVGSTQLGNISTRGFVQTLDNVMIAGVIVQFHDKPVIVRALGPTLSTFGVPSVLADPVLELYDGNGTLIGYNDDWKDDQESDIAATGLAPTFDFESAIVGTLVPGIYTAIVRGFNDTTGNALVEVYSLN